MAQKHILKKLSLGILSVALMGAQAHADTTSTSTDTSATSPYLLDPTTQYQDTQGTKHSFSTIISSDVYNKANGVPKLDANGNMSNKVVGDVSNAEWGATLTLEQYIAQAIKDAAATTAYTGDLTKAYFTVGAETVQNTLSDWIGNIYDVRAYGAQCDGTHDDTTAIQSAVTAAGANNVVKLPAGTCLVSAPINVTSKGVSFIGSGQKASYLINTSTTASKTNVLNVAADNVIISDLSVGTSVAVADTDPAMKLSTTNSVVKNVSVAPYTSSTGTAYFYSEGIDVSSPTGENTGSVWFINNDITLKQVNSGVGIRTSQYNTFILGGEISGAGTGISDSGGMSLSVSGIHLYQPIVGIQVAGAVDSVIGSDVLIDAPSQDGVTYSASTAIKAGFYGTISGNTGSVGISVNSPCTSCQITVGGRISNMTTGLLISDKTSDVTLSPGSILNNNATGVDATTPYVLNKTSFTGSYTANYSNDISDGTRVFHVEDYSSTAQSNVSTALTSAITAACNVGGGEIDLDSVNYTMSTAVSIPCPIVLKGKGFDPLAPKSNGSWLDITSPLTTGNGYFDIKSGGSLSITDMGVYEEQALPSTSASTAYTPQVYQPILYVENGGSLDIGSVTMTNADNGIYAEDGANSLTITSLTGQFLGTAVSFGQTTIPAHITDIISRNYWEEATQSGSAIMNSTQIQNLDTYSQNNAIVVSVRNGSYHHIDQIVGYSVNKVLDISSVDSADGAVTYVPTYMSIGDVAADHSTYGLYVESEKNISNPTMTIGSLMYNGSDATLTSETPIAKSSVVYAGNAKLLLSVGTLTAKDIADSLVTLPSTTACSSVTVEGVTVDYSTASSGTKVTDMASCSKTDAHSVSFGSLSMNTRADGTSVSYGNTTGKLYIPMTTNVLAQ